jgi:hypothetical protein
MVDWVGAPPKLGDAVEVRRIRLIGTQFSVPLYDRQPDDVVTTEEVWLPAMFVGLPGNPLVKWPDGTVERLENLSSVRRRA